MNSSNQKHRILRRAVLVCTILTTGVVLYGETVQGADHFTSRRQQAARQQQAAAARGRQPHAAWSRHWTTATNLPARHDHVCGPYCGCRSVGPIYRLPYGVYPWYANHGSWGRYHFPTVWYGAPQRIHIERREAHPR